MRVHATARHTRVCLRVAVLRVSPRLGTVCCASSDAAHAVFNWPEGLVVEPGARITFSMASRGGIPDAGFTTCTKDVVVLAGDRTPIAQSSDGKVKIYALEDRAGGKHDAELNYGEMPFAMEGAGFYYDPETKPEGEWMVSEVNIRQGGHDYPQYFTVADAQHIEIDEGESRPDSGTHIDATLRVLIGHDELPNETLVIPIARLVVP